MQKPPTVPAAKYVAIACLQDQKRSFATAELSDEKIEIISASKMDCRHKYLDQIM